jgi:flavin-dependent dehydrogenase
MLSKRRIGGQSPGPYLARAMKAIVVDHSPTQSIACDVLVVGGAVSGCALAARLAVAGWRVVVAAPEAPAGDCALHWIGRTGQDRLRRLRCPPELIEQAPEFLGAWGAPGAGLVLAGHPAGDRRVVQSGRLAQALRVKARGSGAQLLSASVSRIYQRETSWRVQLDRTGGGWVSVQARFIVDATGRAAVAAHLLGATRSDQDRLAAWRWVLQRRDDEPQQMVLIESAPQGWWRAIDHSDGRREVTFFSDQDLQSEQSVDWDSVLALALHAPATAQRMLECEPPPRIHAYRAGCSALSEVAGRGWLAVGDAAVTFDPLGLGGLDFALICAEVATGVIAQALTQTPDAALRFADLVRSARAAHALERQARYDAETRWADAPFWQRRREPDLNSIDEAVQAELSALWSGLAVAA